jgi:predicted nucleotidyltransferase
MPEKNRFPNPAAREELGDVAVNLDNLPSVVNALVRMGARTVILFGSAAAMPSLANDIDLAVEGIPPERILDADVAVMDILGQPFDLVARELNPRFYAVVERYGKLLYG